MININRRFDAYCVFFRVKVFGFNHSEVAPRTACGNLHSPLSRAPNCIGWNTRVSLKKKILIIICRYYLIQKILEILYPSGHNNACARNTTAKRWLFSSGESWDKSPWGGYLLLVCLYIRLVAHNPLLTWLFSRRVCDARLAPLMYLPM